MKDITRRMADEHEAYVAKLFGVTPNRGSGNQFHGQMDGRNDCRLIPYAFAWDCKATLSKSIGVSRPMWEKATIQSGFERPCIPLRFYDGPRLACFEDLIVCSLADFHAMWGAANRD